MSDDRISQPLLEAASDEDRARAEALAEQIIKRRDAEKAQAEKMAQIADNTARLDAIEQRLKQNEDAGADLADAVTSGQITGKVRAKVVGYGTGVAGGVIGLIEILKSLLGG